MQRPSGWPAGDGVDGRAEAEWARVALHDAGWVRARGIALSFVLRGEKFTASSNLKGGATYIPVLLKYNFRVY